jgi:hypothetical protein
MSLVEKQMIKNCATLLILLLTAAVMMCGCVKPPEQPRLEQPAAPETAQPSPVTEESKTEPAVHLSSPAPSEVSNAIERMYKNAVIVEAGRFVVGDFNGDGAQDVAVVVKPAEGMLAELNSEVANWILEEPQKVVLPDPSKTTQQLPHRPEPTRVERSDTLLAVLHGYGPAGWRDPRAMQTYLLKNAVGSNMKSQSLTEGLKTARGKGVPKLLGDIIKEAIGGESGFLYYTGARYAWFRTASADRNVTSRR